jgi:hypothetical protein
MEGNIIEQGKVEDVGRKTAPVGESRMCRRTREMGTALAGESSITTTNV